MSSTAEDVIAELREALRGFQMVHEALADPTRPRQAVGEVAATWLSRTQKAVESHEALAKADQHLSSRAVGDGALPDFDHEPDLGASSPEPSLRWIVGSYYAQRDMPDWEALTERYLAALSDRPSDPSVGGEELDDAEIDAICEAAEEAAEQAWGPLGAPNGAINPYQPEDPRSAIWACAWRNAYASNNGY